MRKPPARVETWAGKLGLGWVLITASACTVHAGANSPNDGLTCEQRKSQLLAVLKALPTEGLATPIDVNLPVSTLSGSFGPGPILEVSDARTALSGEVIASDTHEGRSQAVAQKVQALGPIKRLYVAAAQGTDLHTLYTYLRQLPRDLEIKLVFARPKVDTSNPAEAEQTDLAAQVLAERDFDARTKIAERGYEQYASCDPVINAARSVRGFGIKQRWPNLQHAMLAAIPQCACEDLDAPRLRQLLAAEQRAGNVALGSLPASFLRDQRCSASMPLSSVQKLLQDIEEFDEEFSGDWKEDALVFDKVVTDERLANYLCIATPGETLAYRQRDYGNLYWKLPSGECQSWEFEPLSKGAPMGTLKRQGNGPDIALHYWQAVEEIRIYGPDESPKGKATDKGPWACSQNFHMVAIDQDAVSLEKGGQWFFSEQACRAAPASASFSGCVLRVASGLPIAAPQPEAESSEVDNNAKSDDPTKPSTAEPTAPVAP